MGSVRRISCFGVGSLPQWRCVIRPFTIGWPQGTAMMQQWCRSSRRGCGTGWLPTKIGRLAPLPRDLALDESTMDAFIAGSRNWCGAVGRSDVVGRTLVDPLISAVNSGAPRLAAAGGGQLPGLRQRDASDYNPAPLLL